MRRTGTPWMVVAALALTASHAAAEIDPVNTVAKGCEKELATYCKDVTPGQGRILACLYAHGDKISGRCEYALYDASVQLERYIAAMSYVESECSDDLEKFCADVEMGEGRVIDCLNKNREKATERCKQAIRDVAAK